MKVNMFGLADKATDIEHLNEIPRGRAGGVINHDESASPAHGSCMQSSTSLVDPSQSIPPNWGLGLSQALRLRRVPLPQVTLHWPHSSHGDQPPFTAEKTLFNNEPFSSVRSQA